LTPFSGGYNFAFCFPVPVKEVVAEFVFVHILPPECPHVSDDVIKGALFFAIGPTVS